MPLLCRPLANAKPLRRLRLSYTHGVWIKCGDYRHFFQNKWNQNSVIKQTEQQEKQETIS